MTGFYLVCMWARVEPTVRRFQTCFLIRNPNPFHFYLSSRHREKKQTFISSGPEKITAWESYYVFVKELEDRPLKFLASIPPSVSSDDDEAIYKKWREDNDVVKYYIIVSMSPDLAKEYEGYSFAIHIKSCLDVVYVETMRRARLTTASELMSLKISDGAWIRGHCLRMMLLLEKLTYLDIILPIDLSVDIILLSLSRADLNLLDPHLERIIKKLRTRQSNTLKGKER